MSLPLLSRRFLRKATRREHAAAEQTPVMLALFGAQFTVDIYIRLLLGYRALYAEWEATHSRWLAGDLLSSGWRYRSRLPAIESDLHALGAQISGLGGGYSPSASPVPASPGTAGADAAPSWGSLYVVEGSALGGQIIARRLAAEFPGHPHRFFNMGHGSGQPTWRDFQILLDGQLDTAIGRRAVALQAREAFGHFQQMLEGVVS